jgi:hypothetical protein
LESESALKAEALSKIRGLEADLARQLETVTRLENENRQLKAREQLLTGDLEFLKNMVLYFPDFVVKWGFPCNFLL